jgi:hypothetical protein
MRYAFVVKYWSGSIWMIPTLIRNFLKQSLLSRCHELTRMLKAKKYE